MYRVEKERAFTLIEVLLSVLILSFLLLSSTALMHKSLSATTASQDRAIAVKLAAEGIELIKAKRNRNITYNVIPWDKNLPGIWEVDSVQKTALYTYGTFLAADPANPRQLCKRTSPPIEAGKYSHLCSVSTENEPLPGNFTRIVKVTKINEYSIQVTCTVTWHNGAESIQVSTVLYKIS